VSHSTPYSPYPAWDLDLDIEPDGRRRDVKAPRSYGEGAAQGIQAARDAGKTAASKATRKRNTDWIALVLPTTIARGKPVTVKIEHRLPAELGQQVLTVTLKGGPCVTTLLASVVRCSRPEMNPRRNPWLRHHAACQRGAVFKMLDAVIGTTSGSEHGSTLARSVVTEDVAWRGDVWF
jgi:hypothetical protein